MAKKKPASPPSIPISAIDDHWEQYAKELEGRINDLENLLRSQNNEVERLNRELADYSNDKKSEGGSPTENPFSLGGLELSLTDRARLLAACIGVLKDANSQGPLDERNFADQLPRFITQAETVYNALLDHLLHPHASNSPTA